MSTVFVFELLVVVVGGPEVRLILTGIFLTGVVLVTPVPLLSLFETLKKVMKFEVDLLKQ
jgi:hypothetical protein